MCAGVRRCHAEGMSTSTDPGPRHDHGASASHPVDRPADDRADRAASDLVSAGLVHPDRRTEARDVVARALAAPAPGATAAGRARLVEVAGYLGGALVVAAFGLFLTDRWSDLGDTGQVVTLVLVTLLLAGAGAVVAVIGGGYAEMRAGRDDVRRRLTSALLTGSAVAAAFTVGRVVDLVQTGYASWPGALGGIALVVAAAVAYRIAPSVLGLLVMAVGAMTAIISGSDVVGLQDNTDATGLAVLAVGLVWLALAEAGVMHELQSARAIGVAMTVLGAQMPLFASTANLAYGLTAAVAVAGFVQYLRTSAWPYLVGGVAAVTLVVPEAIIDWTEGSLGAGGAVLVAGLTLLAASAAGFRMRQQSHDED